MTEIVIIDLADVGPILAGAVRTLGYRVATFANVPPARRAGRASAVLICPDPEAPTLDLAPVRRVFGDAIPVMTYIPATDSPTALASLVSLGADRILHHPDELREVLDELVGPPTPATADPHALPDDLDLDAYGLEDVPDPIPESAAHTRTNVRSPTARQPRARDDQATVRQPRQRQGHATAKRPRAMSKTPRTDIKIHVYSKPDKLLGALWELVDHRASGILTIESGGTAAQLALTHGMLSQPPANMHLQSSSVRVDTDPTALQTVRTAGDPTGTYIGLTVDTLVQALSTKGRWSLSPRRNPRPPCASVPALMLMGVARAFTPEVLEGFLSRGRCPALEVAGLASLRTALAASLELDNPTMLAALDGTRPLTVLSDDLGFEYCELLAVCFVLTAGGRLSWVVERKRDRTEREQHKRIQQAVALARTGDFLALLGVRPDDPAHIVRAAHRRRVAEFDVDALEPAIAEAAASQLAHLRAALDEARELLCDEALKTLYLSHLPHKDLR